MRSDLLKGVTKGVVAKWLILTIKKQKINKTNWNKNNLVVSIFFDKCCGFINNGMEFSAVNNSLFSIDWILTVFSHFNSSHAADGSANVMIPEPHLRRYQLSLSGNIALRVAQIIGDLLADDVNIFNRAWYPSTLYLCKLTCLNQLLFALATLTTFFTECFPTLCWLSSTRAWEIQNENPQIHYCTIFPTLPP